MVFLDYAGYGFGDDEIIVRQVGDMVIRFPRRLGWDLLEGAIGRFTADFLKERGQPGQTEHRQGF